MLVLLLICRFNGMGLNYMQRHEGGNEAKRCRNLLGKERIERREGSDGDTACRSVASSVGVGSKAGECAKINTSGVDNPVEGVLRTCPEALSQSCPHVTRNSS